MSELVREVEETGLNVQELLNSLDNDENQSIIKLTSKKVKVQLNKIIFFRAFKIIRFKAWKKSI